MVATTFATSSPERPGHVVVGYHQIERSGVASQGFEGLVGARKPADAVTRALQQNLGHSNERLLVVEIDDEQVGHGPRVRGALLQASDRPPPRPPGGRMSNVVPFPGVLSTRIVPP